MAKKMLVLLVLVLSVLSAGCGGAKAPSVDEVVEHQTKKAEAGQVCNMPWIKGNLDISSRLQQLRACDPSESDQAAYDKLLDKTVRKCLELCTDAFDVESTEYGACCDTCKGN